MRVGPRLFFLDADHGTGGPYDLLLVVEGLLGMLFCKYIEVGLADQFAGVGKTHLFCHRPAHPEETAFEVFEINGVRNVVHEGVEQVALVFHALEKSRVFKGYGDLFRAAVEQPHFFLGNKGPVFAIVTDLQDSDGFPAQKQRDKRPDERRMALAFENFPVKTVIPPVNDFYFTRMHHIKENVAL